MIEETPTTEALSDVYVVKKHWIVYVEDFFLHAFGCLSFLLCAYFLASRGAFGGIGQSQSIYGAMALVGFVLIFWTSFFFAWTKQYFDMWRITDTHIVGVNQEDLLSREEVTVSLDKVQDVFFEREGFLSTLLGFGTLRVQSAGIDQDLVIECVADVEHASRVITESRDKRAVKKAY
ncbi:MAG: hypothetical protein RIQ41_303 [Candidatus Parcubacteria bacterium]|jgi:uncharacterized membrane protein YdbT with pleckstrin-like domain